MASYENQMNDNIGGGFGFGGGSLLGILAVIVVLWLLFRGSHGFGDGHGHGGHPQNAWTRPSFTDESNYQQDVVNLKEMYAHDRRSVDENVKTRELIEKLDREGLRDKIAEQALIINTQKAEAFAIALNGRTNAEIGALRSELAAIACGLPKARPQYAQTVTPCLGELPACGPARGGCPDIF